MWNLRSQLIRIYSVFNIVKSDISGLNVERVNILSFFPEFLNWSAGKGKIFLKYARVELRPPTINELPEASARMKKVINSAQTGKWKSVSVKVCRST